jgi:SAM-dependent methyltransferase
MDIDILEEIASKRPHKLVLSNGKGEYRKLVFQRKIIKGSNIFQLEKYTEKQVFHENIEEDKLTETVSLYFPEAFKQLNAFTAETDYDIKAGKKGNLAISRKNVTGKQIVISGNNRKKKYILDEGMDIPVFRELGIFTSEGKVVRSMYDKFRQMNRFIEIVDDVLKNHKGNSINIIDFGCGKSYLTFLLYYYIVEIRHMKPRIVGLDLKEQVINNCNALAEKYGYKDLSFEIGNINGYKADMKVDMVVTLHACDTATDFALYNAICWNADYILSVPCCQHEVNKQIHSDKLSALTKYGIVKERTSALITDAIRGCVLESCGYKTDLMEFINIEHSPKNILIRSVKKNISSDKREKSRVEAESICREFGITQTLMELTAER